MDLVVDQFPAGETTHQIWAQSGSRAEPEIMLHEFTGNTDYGQTLSYTAPNDLPSYRYLKILTTASPSWVSWKEIVIHKKDVTSADAPDKFIPGAYSLAQNYPNPFNPSTIIRYQLPSGGNLSITIYNTLGQTIRNLLNENFSAGQFQTVWDGRNDAGMLIATGVYFYRLETENFSQTRKLLLMR
jgi:hypothetical protein